MIELAAQLPKPVAFVLAGGASYGAVQVGQIRALAKTDIVPDLVVGTSVGALNGVVLAERPDAPADRLAALWSTVSRGDIFGKNLPIALRVVSRQAAAVDNHDLSEFVSSAIAARDFSDLAIPFTAVTTDFDLGQMVPLTSGELVPAVLASAAIPGVFPVIERDGRRLVDGGVVANVPISVAAAQGAKSIVVLDCGFTVLAKRRSDDAPASLMSNLFRMLAIMAAQQVRRDLDAVRDRTVLYLPGPWPIRTRPDDFRRSAQLAQESYQLSLDWLSQLHLAGTGRYGAAPSDALA